MAKVRKTIYLSEEDWIKLDMICEENTNSKGEQIREWIINYEKPDLNEFKKTLSNLERKIEIFEIVLNTFFSINDQNGFFNLGSYQDVASLTSDPQNNSSNIFAAAEDFREAKLIEEKIKKGKFF